MYEGVQGSGSKEKGQAAERTGDGAGTPTGLRAGQAGSWWRSRETPPARGRQHLPLSLGGGGGGQPRLYQSDVFTECHEVCGTG